jgi:hypothetical protein
MQGDEDGTFPFASGVGPEVWAWVRGVDYVRGWREAKDAADGLNAALLGVDIWPSEFRAVADTDDLGRGWVRLIGTAEGASRLAEILELLPQVDPRRADGAA